MVVESLGSKTLKAGGWYMRYKALGALIGSGVLFLLAVVIFVFALLGGSLGSSLLIIAVLALFGVIAFLYGLWLWKRSSSFVAGRRF